MLHAPHSSPGIISIKRLDEIENVLEIRDLVRRFLHEQSSIDQGKDGPPDVSSALDSPVIQDGPGGEAELVDGEIPAGPGQLLTRDMAPYGPLLLAVLQCGQHEQVCSFVKLPIRRADAV